MAGKLLCSSARGSSTTPKIALSTPPTAAPLEPTHPVFVAVLSAKELRCVASNTPDNMKGLASFYSANDAKGNIDSEYTFSIMGRKKDTNYQTEIFFGLAVDAENYSELPVPVRAVACNVSVTKGQLTNQTTDFDLEFCRKYYVGW